MNIFKKLKLNNMRSILVLLLTLVVLGETGYYGYFFMQKQKEVNIYKEKIKKIKIDIKTLKNMDNSKERNTIPKKIISKVKKEFEFHKYKFGAQTGKAIIMEKITKPGTQIAYYKVRVKFKVDSYRAAKLLLTTLYLQNNLVKIPNVDLYHGYIDIIVKEKI